MVAEDGGLVLAEGVGDALGLLQVEHDTRVVVEDGVVVVERAHVLGDRVEQAAQRRPGAPVGGVGVGGGDHVGPGRVHLGVDGEGGPVDLAGALDNVAVLVDQQEVGHLDVPEVHGERVDPEVVGQLGVAGRDVAGHALVEAELGEQPEAGRQPLLPMETLVLDGGERRGSRHVQVGHGFILWGAPGAITAS